MKLSYSLIGSIPEVERFRDALPQMIADYNVAMDAMSAHTSRADRMAISIMAEQIEQCAQHFYGIDTLQFKTMDGIIGAIQALDQDLKVR
jgi:hypothetical protein